MSTRRTADPTDMTMNVDCSFTSRPPSMLSTRSAGNGLPRRRCLHVNRLAPAHPVAAGCEAEVFRSGSEGVKPSNAIGLFHRRVTVEPYGIVRVANRSSPFCIIVGYIVPSRHLHAAELAAPHAAWGRPCTVQDCTRQARWSPDGYLTGRLGVATLLRGGFALASM